MSGYQCEWLLGQWSTCYSGFDSEQHARHVCESSFCRATGQSYALGDAEIQNTTKVILSENGMVDLWRSVGNVKTALCQRWAMTSSDVKGEGEIR